MQSCFLKEIGCVLLLLLFFTSCNKKEEQLQQVLALRQMSDLATVEYVVTKIIKASDNKTWYKLGDRKILMSCKATLTAGIDLAAIKEGAGKDRRQNNHTYFAAFKNDFDKY